MLGFLSQEDSQLLRQSADSVCSMAYEVERTRLASTEDQRMPFVLLRPKLYPDGNQWCALYGENLQEGVCGFGDTPELAMYDFNKNFSSQRILSTAAIAEEGR